MDVGKTAGKPIHDSQALVGYDVAVWQRDAFKVLGYTMVVPPPPNKECIPDFWEAVASDGRLDKLKAASSTPPWVLGLGSWDPECEERGQRYTICIEESGRTDLDDLSCDNDLFRKDIGASEWLCFALDNEAALGQFWRHNPYKMMTKLGYRFHTGDYSVGLHFDAFPAEYNMKTYPAMEFWITVVKS